MIYKKSELRVSEKIVFLGSTIEIFTFDGHKVNEQIMYPQVGCPNGIFIDDVNNIITDTNCAWMLVFNHKNMLVRRIGGFYEPRDVTKG